MDTSTIQQVLNSFNTIPSADIQQLLTGNNIPISSDNRVAYETARNLLLTGNLQSVPSIIFADWIIAYRLANTNIVPRFNISTILQASPEQLQILAQSLSLNGINKERIFRILRFLGVLDDDMSLFEYVPEELLLKTLEYYPVCDIPLVCNVTPTFNRLCQKDSFLNLMRRLLGEKTGYNTSEFTMDQLKRLCKIKLYDTIVAGNNNSFLIGYINPGVYGFGNNRNSQLGLGPGADTQVTIPTLIPNLDHIVEIASSYNHTLALNRFKQVYVFGDNRFGQLGSSNPKTTNLPTLIPGLNNIVSVACGLSHSLFLIDNGQVYFMGYNNLIYPPLPNSQSNIKSSPTIIDGLNNIISISSSEGHILALTRDGRVYGLGNNDYGQLGLGHHNSTTIPLLIPKLEDIVSVSAGLFHSLALNSQGQVYVFGNNDSGQLGLQNYRYQNRAVLIPDLNDIISISVGSDHSLLLNVQGRVYAFGDNSSGQLGLGDYNNRDIPTVIPGLENIKYISAGGAHSLIATNHQLYSFGNGEYGQLGHGDTLFRNQPALVNL